MKDRVIFGSIGCLVGIVAGFFAANAVNRHEVQNTSAASQTNVQAAPTPPPDSAEDAAMLSDVNDTLSRAESDPQNFAAQMRAGDMYARIGRFEKAIEYYKRGLLINPSDFNANVVLANALFDSQKFEEASDYYAKAVSINGKDINARTDLGTTFVERPNPDYDRGIKEFKQALEIDPKHEPTIYYLGIAYHRKGDEANARKALEQLKSVNANSQLVTRLEQNMAAPK